MIYQQLRVHAEKIVQNVFIFYGAVRNITHSVKSRTFQPCSVALPYPPEIGYGSMLPQGSPIRHFIEFRNAHTVLVRRYMLCDNIHSHFSEIQIGPDSGSRGYSGLREDIAYHQPCKLMRCHFICSEI